MYFKEGFFDFKAIEEIFETIIWDLTRIMAYVLFHSSYFDDLINVIQWKPEIALINELQFCFDEPWPCGSVPRSQIMVLAFFADLLIIKF